MNLRDKIIQAIKNNSYANGGYTNTENTTNEIISEIEKRIDKVEQDYKSKLGNWGKQQPMTDMYPKEMDALNKVRKQIKND